MKIAFCFAGQGAQYIGMGKDFYANNDLVKDIYDKFPKVRELCFLDKEGVLNQTAYAQEAMLLTGYAIASLLKEQGITPEFVCGLSLGEYTALTFAKAWSLDDAMKIIATRGKIMQNALPLGTTKMAAILGLDRDKIKEIIKNIKGVCEIANYNCPGQIVITGESAAIDEACKLLVEGGARRAVPLNVSGAFHSSLLNDASKELRNELNKYENKKPIFKVVYNISGKEENIDLNDILQKQICNSVYFEDSIRYLISKGVDTFIEIGPGSTLSSFIRKTSPDVKVINVSTYENVDQCMKALNN